jgi:hypothetical protein
MVDNNLSPSLARSFQPLFDEHQFVSLRDKFAANTKDIDWIGALDAEGGWAALTAERRLKTRPHERLALDRSKIVFFFLNWIMAEMVGAGNGVAANSDGAADGKTSGTN